MAKDNSKHQKLQNSAKKKPKKKLKRNKFKTNKDEY